MYLRRKSLIHVQENEKTRHLAIVYKRTPFPRPFGKKFLIRHSNHIQTTSWSVDHPQTVSSKKLFSCIFLFSKQSAVTNLVNTHKQPTTNSQSLQQEGDIQPRPKSQLTNKSHQKWVAAVPRPPAASPSTATFALCAPHPTKPAKSSSHTACSGLTQTAATPKRPSRTLAVGSTASSNARKEREGARPTDALATPTSRRPPPILALGSAASQSNAPKERAGPTGADPRTVAVPRYGRIAYGPKPWDMPAKSITRESLAAGVRI